MEPPDRGDTAHGESSLAAVAQTWETLAREDPLWAILSAPDKRGGKWDRDEFLQSGVNEVEALIAELRYHGISFSADRALDFGCGIGRLTQALTKFFATVVGVDVAPTMIDKAREANKYPGKCSFIVNQKTDLSSFPSDEFSFVLSSIVLQHIPTELAKKYITEFIRILRPGGLAVFQLPSRFIQETILPPAAFRAQISCATDRLDLRARSQTTLEVTVTNMSSTRWEFNEPFTINLGNHWRREDGVLVAEDDGRAPLPNNLSPNEKVTLQLPIRAPAEPGNYHLELDLVQEGVCWFAPQGSRQTVLDACITTSQSAAATSKDKAAPSADPDPPQTQRVVFDMHCIPRAEVVELLDGNGCKIEFIAPTGAGGKGTLSYYYYARKREGPRLSATTQNHQD